MKYNIQNEKYKLQNTKLKIKGVNNLLIAIARTGTSQLCRSKYKMQNTKYEIQIQNENTKYKIENKRCEYSPDCNGENGH